jgi:NADH:ubiquinone oxidoreductase subunit 6 (subunit J)
MTNSEIQAGDSATDRLAKLLPAEVTAAYVSIRSVVETSNYSYALVLLLLSAAIMAIISVFYVARFKGITNQVHRALYAITFLLWAVALDSTRIADRWLNFNEGFSLSITIATVLWTFVIQLAIPTQKLTSP